MTDGPNEQRCGTCRYFRTEGRGYADDRDVGADAGDCVRYPPTLTSHGEPFVSDARMSATQHPLVLASEWCGEYAPANPETVTDGCVTLARLVLLGDLTAARALADKLRE